ncbi:NUDIX domain-containing protein [Candidatus Woesearchaeota archaeon]|nr:NUDIX domain-containing protein [Candidatus Woesearchaeota archaeon]
MSIKIVVGCLIVKDNAFAYVEEKKEGIKGLLNLPAGGLEGNETIESCAKREALEETGLYVRPERLLGIYQFPDRSGLNVIKFMYLAYVEKGKLKTGDVQYAGWMTFDESKKVPHQKWRDASVELTIDAYLQKTPLQLRYCHI